MFIKVDDNISCAGWLDEVMFVGMIFQWLVYKLFAEQLWIS